MFFLDRHGAEDLPALGHVGEAAGDALVCRHRGDVGPVDQNLPRSRRHDADQRFHRRLAHAIAPDQGHDLARRNREVDAVDNLALPVGRGKIANFEHRLRPSMTEINFLDLRIGLHRMHVALARTLPSCITVTPWRSARQSPCRARRPARCGSWRSREESRRSTTLGLAHAGDRLIEQQQLAGSWASSIAISSHWCWPWRDAFAGRSR